jgi:ATP-dependent Lon protease
MRQGAQLFSQYVKLNKRISTETALSLQTIEDPSRFADVIAGNLLIRMSDKQPLLEAVAIDDRLEKVVEILHAEIEILNIERRIHNRVRNQIEKTQKEYYLNEQMKAINVTTAFAFRFIQLPTIFRAVFHITRAIKSTMATL